MSLAAQFSAVEMKGVTFAARKLEVEFEDDYRGNKRVRVIKEKVLKSAYLF